ncbi:hypothetical protein [Geomesophilobacter sediminis]|uniref:Band 7 domain-containing protein n=1 Tax=Geomesophilobacter sediminis TaxID=2798584 RepID=A0A8J7IMX6_9BACT|nr:hypothetical protein [Geomesophilobacter sediminis]MBJ6723229.1 hypothetical protein [Geomesophilobacter sediminis]
MFVQRLIRFLGRMIFYFLMLPALIGLIYTLAEGELRAALVFLIVFVLVLYFGLVRIRVPANSVMVRKGKVVYFIPEKSVRDRFDFASRGQTIVELPSFRLLDRPHVVEIFFPDRQGGVISCRLSLTLSYIMDLTSLQRAYDYFIRYQDELPLIVKRKLYNSAARITWPSPPKGDEDANAFVQPALAELNSGLETLGMKIEEATCTFDAGSTLARLVSDEQVTVERIDIE